MVMSHLEKVLISSRRSASPSSRIRHNVVTNIGSDETRDYVEISVMRLLT